MKTNSAIPTRVSAFLHFLILTASVLSPILVSFSAKAMRPITQQELIAGDGAEEDSFGFVTAISKDGQIVVVGAPGRNSFKGAVYIFAEHDGRWSLQQELYASDGSENDFFGGSVAVSSDGHTVMIGAGGKNSNTGAVYIFQKHGDTWLQSQELHAADGAAGDFFGGYSRGVGIGLNGDGHVALIAALGKNSFQGAAYVFVAHGDKWSQQQELQAPDGVANDEFALSVAINGDGHTAMVGAIGRNSFVGAAYIFIERGSTWVLQQELVAFDGAGFDKFGFSVSLAGNGQVALIGAFGRNGLTGASYVFTQHGGIWSQGQELQASDATSGDRFGGAVVLSDNGNTVLVGAPAKNSFTGAAYVFINHDGRWTQRQELEGADPSTGNFGWATALGGDGKVAVIGAVGTQNDTGAAFVMQIPKD